MIVQVVRALNYDVKVTIIVILRFPFPYDFGKCGKNWLQHNVINVKGGSHIRQSVKLCYYTLKWGLPKSESSMSYEVLPLNIRHGNGTVVVV